MTERNVKAEEETKGGANEGQKQEKNSPNPPEPPKDYIHVRARRGQATDSHSLAERVRIPNPILSIIHTIFEYIKHWNIY